MDPFLLLVIIGALSIVIIFLIVFWSDNTNLNSPKIKFSSLKKFYEVNPTRWKFRGGTVYCYVDTCEYETFHLGCIDFYRCWAWTSKLDKAEQQEKYNESTKRMMDVVRQDIADAEAKAKATRTNVLDDLAKYAEQYVNKEFDIMSFIEEYKKIYERKNP